MQIRKNLCKESIDKNVKYCGIVRSDGHSILVVFVGSPRQQIDIFEKQI